LITAFAEGEDEVIIIERTRDKYTHRIDDNRVIISRKELAKLANKFPVIAKVKNESNK
jgi:hypothetical protein